jgi:polyhydroxyalkanoate synthase
MADLTNATGMMSGVATRAKNLAALVGRGRPPVGTTPADVVHTENKLRLLRYTRKGEARFRSPVLIVPSLINRHYVLDLLPGQSFVEYLVEQGHDVFMIDWGTPSSEDRELTFDDVCDRYIGRAVRVAARLSGSKVHLFGYCLGGTLATIYASANPELVASLVNLAAPVRFADDEGQLAAWTRSPTFSTATVTDAFGNAPAWLLQASFHMLRPTLTLSKLVHMLDRSNNPDFLTSFAALETWGNDNVDFAGGVFQRYIDELYREDRFARGTFRLGGRPARPEAIDAPVLCVTFEHDNIVPYKSAAALLELVASKDKEHIHLPGGHVGAVVSKSAKKHLWPRLSAWMGARDVGSTADEPERQTKDEPRSPSRKKARAAARLPPA